MMSELRDFKQTDVLTSYGYIFWSKWKKESPIRIGFMRRPQPEIHHGKDFPWVMATVGGMRHKNELLEPEIGPNAEGFMGRPPTGDEIATAQLQLKLGVKVGAELYVPPLEGWLEVTHPFYYGNATPDVRNVGMVKRKVRLITSEGYRILQDALKARNSKVKPEHVHELMFFTSAEFETHVVGGNHSLKAGELMLIRQLYGVLSLTKQTYFRVVMIPELFD